jgi:hypothetical protein
MEKVESYDHLVVLQILLANRREERNVALDSRKVLIEVYIYTLKESQGQNPSFDIHVFSRLAGEPSHLI